MNDDFFYLGFSYFNKIGPVKFNALIDKFGTPQAAYTAPIKDYEGVMDFKIAHDFDQFRRTFNYQKEIKKIEQMDITLLTRTNPNYP